MEFELLDNDEYPAHSLEAVRRYLQNPRRQMQAWGDKVPQLASALVFALVVVEWVLAKRLSEGSGRGVSAIAQVIGLAVVIFIAESILVSAAAGISAISGKSGNRWTAMAYLSLGLTPLLLVLPVALLCEAANLSPAIRTLVTMLLGIKVLATWKDAIETTFKLNRLQGLAAFYFAVGASTLIGMLIFYVIAIGKIAAIFD